jgi:DNA-directed RNA polymerase specialized sigma24 family protein
MKREPVDFSYVQPEHLALHGRLENWARWCRDKPVFACQPMFRLYRPDNYERAPALPIDALDAARLQRFVGALPPPERMALQWHYVHPCSPVRAARALRRPIRELDELVRRARQMLVNRQA